MKARFSNKNINHDFNRKGVTFKEQYELLEKSFIQRRLHANNTVKFDNKKVVSPRLQANNTIKFNDRKVNPPKMEPVKQRSPMGAYNSLRNQLKTKIIELINKRNPNVDLADNDLKAVISKGRALLSSKGIQIEQNIQIKFHNLDNIHAITRESRSISKKTLDNTKTLIIEIYKEFKNKFHKIKWKMDSKMNGRIEDKTNKIDKLNQTAKEDDVDYETNPK